MSKLEDAKVILRAIGLPAAQQNEISALTLLALCGIKPRSSWNSASRQSLKITKGIMQFVKDFYKKSYAPNTRETFRRQVLHHFVQARIADYNPDNPRLPVNSPNAHYASTSEALRTIKTFGTQDWKNSTEKFISKVGNLSSKYKKERKQTLIPVKINGRKKIKLSAGKHNEIQAAIIEQFAARFATRGKLVFVGDTAKKDLYIDYSLLKKLRIPIDTQNKLPDVMIYDKSKDWLFLIETVASHGPVSPKRLLELKAFLKHCRAGKIYVTAFPDFSEFKRHSQNIAWETEVWVMEAPDHMIHFNGDKFLGPR